MDNKIRAILFDLDGTLLDSNMQVLLPKYYQLLSARMANLIPPQEFIARLQQASEAMMFNDGQRTNQEVFAAAFYPLAGYSQQDLEPILLDFYAREFPTLRKYTGHKPEARPVVQAAFDLGYDVVVATNPLFPATAIEQRLEWAGVADLPYRLVTTYENSRACKPNRIYFEQIMEQTGHSAGECLMVGDEDWDMVAAHLGLATFLIPGPETNIAPTTPQPTYSGTLTDLGELLQSWGERNGSKGR